MYAHWLRSTWSTVGPNDVSGDFKVEHDLFGPGTSGTWMRAFTGADSQRLPGTDCASLMLIDTQGIAGNTKALHDMLLLSMIASSAVMLNVMYLLNEDALEHLRGLTAHAAARLPADWAGGNAPKLLVLLRDARLRLEHEGRAIMPSTALHAALAPSGGRLDGVRQQLSVLFPSRTMALMRQPDDDDLARMSAAGVPLESRPFWASFAETARAATAALVPKAVGGITLSGEVLAATLADLMLPINARRGKVSMHRAVFNRLHRQAKAAVASARHVFRELVPPPETSAGRLAVTLPAASLEFRLRNATQAAYEEFVSRVPRMDATSLGAWMPPFAEQLDISLAAESRQQRQAHEHAARLASARAAADTLRAEADSHKDMVRWLLSQQRSAARTHWQDVAGNAMLVTLAAVSIFVPGAWAAKFGPAMLAPIAGMGLWRAAARPFAQFASKAASSVLGLVKPPCRQAAAVS